LTCLFEAGDLFLDLRDLGGEIAGPGERVVAKELRRVVTADYD